MGSCLFCTYLNKQRLAVIEDDHMIIGDMGRQIMCGLVEIHANEDHPIYQKKMVL